MLHLGYKKLANNLLAILEIYDIHNEKRSGIVNPNYAQFRAAKVRCIQIYDIFSHKEHNVGYSIRNNNFKYEVGTMVTVDDFDLNDNDEIIGRGIHYFKSEDAAYWYYFKIFNNYTGSYFHYNINGRLVIEGSYQLGKCHGKWITWYDNGVKRDEGCYNNGKYNGLWTFYQDNGKKRRAGSYVNNIKSDGWKYWNFRGKQIYHTPDGSYTEYYRQIIATNKVNNIPC